MNGATQDHDPTGVRSRACKHHLLVPGNRPTAGRRYRRRHCSTRPFGMHTAPASSALLSGAASRGQRSCRCILSRTKRLSHDRARRRRDLTVTPSGCWWSAGRPHRPVLWETARRSPIPFGRKRRAFSWIIEIVHHAVDAKLLQHSAITLWLTYGAIIGIAVLR